MSNESPNELRIEREIDLMVDAIIGLLPSEVQTNIIRKEAERREKTRIETAMLEARRKELDKQWEALEGERDCQRKRKLQQWEQQIDELEHFPAVPEARVRFRHMIELMFEGCQEMATSKERIELMKTINEKRNELLAPLDKELEELAERMTALSPPEAQAEIRKQMAERWAQMRVTPPHIDFVTGLNNTRFFNEVRQAVRRQHRNVQ
jgi:hypothetical protein